LINIKLQFVIFKQTSGSIKISNNQGKFVGYVDENILKEKLSAKSVFIMMCVIIKLSKKINKIVPLLRSNAQHFLTICKVNYQLCELFLQRNNKSFM
jgi:hypothetical protein